MDVEGYEPQVFAGATSILKKPSLVAVITETTDLAIQAVLENSWFMRASYNPIERTIVAEGKAARSAHNTLFVRPDQVGKRLQSAPVRHVAGVNV